MALNVGHAIGIDYIHLGRTAEPSMISRVGVSDADQRDGIGWAVFSAPRDHMQAMVCVTPGPPTSLASYAAFRQVFWS